MPPGKGRTTWQAQIWFPTSPLKAIRAKAPGVNIQFDAGTDLASAAAVAKTAEVAIVFAYQWESEGMDLDNLSLPDRQPSRSAQFVFLLVTAALWLGLIDACREIVKERSIIVRELAAGVRLDGYLIAKASLLFVLAAVQCLLLVAVATAIQPLHAHVEAYLALTGLLILASWCSVALGLLVSTLARSVDQATSLIPLLLIPQLLFGGGLVAFARMGSGVKAIADLMVSRWAFAGTGSAIEMNARLADAPQVAALSGYGSSFFSLNEVAGALILLGFTAGLLLVTAILLARLSQAA